MRRIHHFLPPLCALLLCGWRCEAPDAPDRMPPESYLVAEWIGTGAAPADGTSTLRMSVGIVPGMANMVDRSRNALTITTSAGSFLVEGEKKSQIETTPAPDRRDTIELIAPAMPGDVEIGVALKSDPLTRIPLHGAFVDALPDTIVVDPGAFELTAGLDNETDVTAYLIRRPGEVTDGLRVTFSARPIGRFRASSLVAADGKATTKFSVPDPDFEGTVTITATVDGTERSGSERLEIKKPE